MSYSEATFTTNFLKWLAREKVDGTAVFELKLAKGKSLPFSAIKDHQLRNLKLAQKMLVYKIPDAGYDQKPFDCFQICKAEAFIVVIFYKKGQREFIVIPIDTWIHEMRASARKSLTKERAEEIGLICKL